LALGLTLILVSTNFLDKSQNDDILSYLRIITLPGICKLFLNLFNLLIQGRCSRAVTDDITDQKDIRNVDR